MRLFIIFLALSCTIFCNEKPHTVVALLEAKAGCEESLKEALKLVAQASREEASNIEYRVYQDKECPTKFAFYEKWKSQELHQEQFSKSYIHEFAKQAEPLLAKPYQGLFGSEVQ